MLALSMTVRHATLPLSLEAFECFSSSTSVHFPVQPISSSPWAQLETHRSFILQRWYPGSVVRQSERKKGWSTLHDLATSAIADSLKGNQQCLCAPVSWWQQHSDPVWHPPPANSCVCACVCVLCLNMFVFFWLGVVISAIKQQVCSMWTSNEIPPLNHRVRN